MENVKNNHYQKYFSKILGLTYSVVGFFIVVILFHPANYASAANNAPTAPTSTSAINTSTIQYNWTSGGGSETYYTVDQSTDGSSYTFVATTTQTHYLFSNLSPNTRYWFRVASGDGVGATSTYVTSSPKYTLANRVTYAVISVTTSSITFSVDYPTSNSSSTLYRMSTTLDYYDSAGNATSTTDLFYTSSTLGSPITIRGVQYGLSLGTTLSINAKNGDGTVGGANNISVSAAPYAPTLVSLSNPTINSFNLSFDRNLNVSVVSYGIYNQTLGNYIDQDGYATSTFFRQASSTWGASIEPKGLSANTAYQFYVIAHNGSDLDYDTNATSSLSSALYTLASSPSISNISRSSDTNQITVTWSGNAAAYYLENITTGVSSGWTSGSSYTFSNVTCNTSYSFRIKGRNGDGVETDYSSTVLSSSSCGGGGAVEPSKPALSNPALPAVALKSSGSGQANFQFNIKNATQVAISEEPSFTNVGWMTLQNPFTYTWPQGKNVSVLYIKFRSVDGGESQVFKVENLYFSQTNSNSVSTSGSVPIVQQLADLVFTKIPTTNIFKRLQTIKFTYTYTNNATTNQTIKVVRSLWVNNGKERKLSQVYGFRTIKPGQSFSVPVSQYLNKTLSNGNYSIRVEIFDSKGKVVKARNSFDFEITK